MDLLQVQSSLLEEGQNTAVLDMLLFKYSISKQPCMAAGKRQIVGFAQADLQRPFLMRLTIQSSNQSPKQLNL